MGAIIDLWQALVHERASATVRWSLGPLLSGLSRPYEWGHRLRLRAYRGGWAPVKWLPCRVISVGNLTVGGAGKTPVVVAVAALLHQHGRRVGVLSRGYGGRRRQAPTIVSDGRGCLEPPQVAGDEPVLVAEHVPGVPVIVGKDRYAAGMLAVQRFGVEVVVLDDGFQHVQLGRDLDILVLDAARPFGNGRLLPRGDLRERPDAIARADAIVVTRWESGTVIPELGRLRAALPVFFSQYQPVAIRRLDDGQRLPPSAFAGRRVLAFCGIGDPWRFPQALQRLGVVVADFVPFPDHHPYRRAELEELARRAKAREAVLLTTEKDGVRLRPLRPLPAAIWELCMRVGSVAPEDRWRACVLGGVDDRAPGGGPRRGGWARPPR
jgi:tetraacyldisaccharide 4'-kinase